MYLYNYLLHLFIDGVLHLWVYNYLVMINKQMLLKQNLSQNVEDHWHFSILPKDLLRKIYLIPNWIKKNSQNFINRYNMILNILMILYYIKRDMCIVFHYTVNFLLCVLNYYLCHLVYGNTLNIMSKCKLL